jgi:hypothetical protein
MSMTEPLYPAMFSLTGIEAKSSEIYFKICRTLSGFVSILRGCVLGCHLWGVTKPYPKHSRVISPHTFRSVTELQ